MSDHDRKKKDGQDKNKKMQAMHEAVKERQEASGGADDDDEHEDQMRHNIGAAGIPSIRGAG